MIFSNFSTFRHFCLHEPHEKHEHLYPFVLFVPFVEEKKDFFNAEGTKDGKCAPLGTVNK